MSEMVERVARALSAADDPDMWDELERKYPGEEMQDKYRASARAAIEAMREPTKEMKWSGCIDLGSGGELGEGDNITEVWQLMIDAALKAG